jgi:hypothetical protein
MPARAPSFFVGNAGGRAGATIETMIAGRRVRPFVRIDMLDIDDIADFWVFSALSWPQLFGHPLHNLATTSSRHRLGALSRNPSRRRGPRHRSWLLRAPDEHVVKRDEPRIDREWRITLTPMRPTSFYLALAGPDVSQEFLSARPASRHPTVRELRQEDKSAGLIRLGPCGIRSDAAQKTEAWP